MELQDISGLLTTYEVLDILKFGESTLRRRVYDNKIAPAVVLRKGAVTTYYYRPEDVERLLRGGTQQGDVHLPPVASQSNTHNAASADDERTDD